MANIALKNITKDFSGGGDVDKKLLQEEAEKNLYQVLQEVKAEASPLFEDKNYQQAMGAILKMKEPIDLFFDKVMVMADDEKVKTNRSFRVQPPA